MIDSCNHDCVSDFIWLHRPITTAQISGSKFNNYQRKLATLISGIFGLNFFFFLQWEDFGHPYLCQYVGLKDWDNEKHRIVRSCKTKL